jgi:hypothetical protein
MKLVRFTLIASSLALAATGCHRNPVANEGPWPAPSVPQVAREEQYSAVILDGIVAGKIAVEKQQIERDAQGRMVVYAHIRNRTNYDQSIDVQTVFKDEDGLAYGDDTAWTRLSLGPNETQSYTGTSIDDRPARYTIRIRSGR